MRSTLAGVIVFSCAAACSSQSERIDRLHEALDRAEVSLAESATTAERESGSGTAVTAKLDVSADAVFTIGVIAAEGALDFRVDIVNGEVLSVDASARAGGACPGSISLSAALAAAEVAGGGTAVAVVPDDDVACAREIQVLTADALIEVKVAGDGEILEVEASDEDL